MLGVYEKSMPESFSLRQKLETAKAAGFDFLEISIDESDAKLARLDWSESELADLKDDIRATGLPVYTMCLSGHRRFPLGSRDKAIRERSLDIMRKAVDFAAVAGIKIIQLAGYDVYYEEGGADTEAYFTENLKISVGMAAEKNIILAFETMETPFMNTIEKAMKYVKLINSPYLQVYPDLGNVRNGAEDYLADIEAGRGHIAAAHLKETVAGVYRNMFFGEGRVDFKGCIGALKAQGVDTFAAEFWYDGKSEPLSYLKRAREFLAGYGL